MHYFIQIRLKIPKLIRKMLNIPRFQFMMEKGQSRAIEKGWKKRMIIIE